MKKLSVFNKIIYFLNIITVVLTFLAYVLPFLAPKLFPFFAVLTLILPLFLILNALFFIYWLLQLKKQVLLSSMILLLGITFLNKFYKFSSRNIEKTVNDIAIMSYNVRLFNLFEWMPNKNVGSDILQFVYDENPDILCIQEFSSSAKIDFKSYKYNHKVIEGKNIKTGQAIFSKFPIINSGKIDFPLSDGNVIFADIIKEKDTIRVYNMHLESIKISPDVNEFEENVEVIDKQKSQIVFNRLSKAFKKQDEQAELFTQHIEKCNYPMIICGDMNNSAFSYVYRSIKGNLNDCFEEAGKGFGQTYNFKYYPARIDYIFADKKFKVKNFQNFPHFVNSDHYPVTTRLVFEKGED